VTGKTAYTWAATLTASSNAANYAKALQKAGSTTERIAAIWYTSTNYSLDVSLSDTNTHQIALYALDYDGGRAVKVDVIDKATGTIMDSRSLSSFGSGVYLVWTIKGSVTFKITNANPSSNAGISGIFFR
jgi:thymidine phosphorylase